MVKGPRRQLKIIQKLNTNQNQIRIKKNIESRCKVSEVYKESDVGIIPYSDKLFNRQTGFFGVLP